MYEWQNVTSVKVQHGGWTPEKKENAVSRQRIVRFA